MSKKPEHRGYIISGGNITIPKNTENTAVVGKMQISFEGNNLEEEEKQADLFMSKQRIMQPDAVYRVYARFYYRAADLTVNNQIPLGIDALFSAVRTFGPENVLIRWFRAKDSSTDRDIDISEEEADPEEGPAESEE